MNKETFDLLTPLYPLWRTYVEHQYSPFTNQQYEIAKEAFSRMYGPPPRNLHCKSCIDDLLKRVFNAYERFKQESEQVVQQPKRTGRRKNDDKI